MLQAAKRMKHVGVIDTKKLFFTSEDVLTSWGHWNVINMTSHIETTRTGTEVSMEVYQYIFSSTHIGILIET